jgi:hypothetical protein
LTLDRKTYRLQDEAPQGRQVSHEDTLSEEPHRPSRSRRTQQPMFLRHSRSALLPTG